MKVEKTASTLPAGKISDGNARGTSTRASTAPQQSGTSVSLGATATQLAKMQSSMDNTSVVDANKVAEIKKAISDGRFQVNSGLVADRLIQSVHDLINKSQA